MIFASYAYLSQYFIKGSANLCGFVEVINEDFTDETIKRAVEDRLMPRTEDLPIYTTEEFNEKVLSVWVPMIASRAAAAAAAAAVSCPHCHVQYTCSSSIGAALSGSTL